MIEQRKNLLKAWAIHCDAPDCHMECLGIDEDAVTAIATGLKWVMPGNTHTCPDCAAGTSPASIAAAERPEPAGATPAPEPGAGADGLDDDDDDDDEDAVNAELAQAIAKVQAQATTAGAAAVPDPTMQTMPPQETGEQVDIKDLFPGKGSLLKNKEQKGPYRVDPGDTIPGVTQAAADKRSPEDEAAEERRMARLRKRMLEKTAGSRQATLEAMGGVTDMLNDFDGMFGQGKTTWDD